MPRINKLLPRYLNTDDDERLIKSSEMTDAQNVRVAVDVEKDSLVLKNAWGNTLRSGTIQNGSSLTGTSVTIGVVADDNTSQIYYFVYNSNLDHTIFRYDQNSKQTFIVFQNSILQFSEDGFIDADLIRLANNDILIYFNDGRSAPKKINATLCEESVSGVGGYPTKFTTGTVQERLQYITAAKAPPLSPPTLEFKNNPSFPQNDIFTKNFQFAYQYEYFDGEQSALSPYSELSVAPNQLKDGFNNQGQQNFFNQINIGVLNSVADVSRIKIYGRVGDKDAAFFLIDTIDNINGTTKSIIRFRNDTNYIGLSATVQDKVFDNVPQVADSQAIANGRLYYGGYTEGYNPTSTNISLRPNYNARPSTDDIIIQAYAGTDNEFTIDTTGLTLPIAEASTLFLSFTWNDGAVIIKNTLGNANDYNFLATQGANFISLRNDVNNSLATTFPEEIKALAGLRTDRLLGGTKINQPNGVLNSPPNLRFVVQKGTSDTKEKDIGVRKIVKGIRVISSGVQFRETIELAANDTRADVVLKIRNAISKNRPISFDPQSGEAGFSVLRTGGQTSTNQENASFKGQGLAFPHQQNQTESDSSGILRFRMKLERVTFSINKLTFGDQETELIEPKGIASTFDIIEGSINNAGQTNALTFGNPAQFTPTIGGQFIKMTQQFANLRGGSIVRNGSYVSNGGCFVIANNKMFGDRCFKSGSTHQFGIVHFDDRGRAGSVEPIGSEVFVDHTNNRSGEDDNDGFANIVARLINPAPYWASTYSIVYAGQGSIINKVQYTIGGAYVATNDNSNQGSFGATKSIYLSLNTLQSKANSYDNQMGAQINYGYASGDILRIVQYGNNEKSVREWRVSKVVSLLADPLTNPLLDQSSKAAIENTTGDFIVIEDNGTLGFNYNSISNNNSNWDNNCLIEIYRPTKAFEDLFYYEIGVNGTVDSSQSYSTQRSSTTTSIKLISSPSVGDGQSFQFFSSEQLYKGDVIANGGNEITVGNVSEDSSQSGFLYECYGVSNFNWATDTTISMTVTNPDAVLSFSQGDSYFRLRTLFTGAAPTAGDTWKNIATAFSQNSVVEFIEDPRVSDFFSSNFTSLGRRFAYLPNERRIKRFGSLTWSDTFDIDSLTLGLSSFNITQINYVNLSYDYGSIKALVSYNQIMYVIHERRAGIVPVDRNLLTAPAGDTLTATNKVVGPVKYYAAEYGCNDNAESVATYRGSVFFVDAKAGKVCKINSDTGIQVISENLMDSFFKSKMFSSSASAMNRKYIGGLDRENNEYIISSPALNTSTITIVDNLTSELSATTVTGLGRTNSAGTAIEVTPVYNNELTFNWSSDPRDFAASQDKTNKSGEALLIVDQLTNTPIVAVAEDLEPAQSNSASLNTAIELPLLTSSFSAFTPGEFNQQTGAISISTSSASSSGTITNTAETLPSFTVAYDVRSTFWSTRYSYIAEQITGLSDRLYTFKDGEIYEHEPTAARNTFYGVAAPSIVEVVANYNPSMVKVYEAVSLEGNNKNWSVELANTDQTSALATSTWEEKEGFYYAPIHQDSNNTVSYTATADITTVKGTSEVFSLGVVDSVSTDVITFKNSINNMSFPLGNSTALFKINTGTGALVPLVLYASSVSGRTTLVCSGTVSGVAQDDTIILIGNSPIEGDSIRDYYLKAKLSNSITTPHELYAINFIYSKSNLHNQQGQ